MLTRKTLENQPSARTLLSRVLETPELPTQIRALPGPVLGKLIDHVGLADAGELVALATTAQLAQIFDEDLWQSPAPGQDPRFDSERFLVWLSIMHEAGEHAVAERLAELPIELVTLAFHRHLLVMTEDALRAELTPDDDEADAAEKAFESCLSEELDEYQLIWRGGEGWDDVLSALLALDREHHAVAVDILERCAHLSREYIDDNGGLYEVLSSEEMLESDLAAERETRRTERGYVAPSQAAAFLRLALAPVAASSADTPAGRDPLTRAYFRELARAPVAAGGAAGNDQRPRLGGRSAEAAEPRGGAPASPLPNRLARLLADSGIVEEAAPARLSGEAASQREVPLLIDALGELAADSPALFAERSEELAYLSNVLLAGASVDGRRLRPAEAVDHAIVVVSLGLWLACGGPAATPTDAARQLRLQPCDVLFRLAFARARNPKLRSRLKSAARDLTRVRTLLKTLKV